VYRLSFPQGELHNKALPVSGGVIRHWSVQVPEAGAAFDHQPPQLRIGWLSHSLVFITRGRGLFTLAVGSATAKPLVRDARAILREVGLNAEAGADGFGLPRATVLRTVELGGEEKLEVPPPPTNWKRLLSWIVLVAGVALLLWMAWTLLRTSPSKDPKDAPPDGPDSSTKNN
jgi:hypothetical protein